MSVRSVATRTAVGALTATAFLTPAFLQTPATFTWTVTGTKKTDDLLVAAVQGGGTMLGIRLPDVTVR
jgi:hypothetical protein